ncbi:MAG: DMT family transporter [Thiolinea sp.]
MQQSNPIKAALWMLGAVVSFSSMAVAGREMAHELDTFEIMLYRSLIGIVIVLLVARFAGTLGEINRRHLKLHFLRNLSHFTGQNLWFYAIALIPFAQLAAFEFSTPLWVAILAPFFLTERLTRTRIIAALIGFVGILMVAKPGSMSVGPGTITAALCAIGFAGAYICTKLLARTETTTCILFWLTVIQAILGIIFVGYDGDITLPTLSTLPGVFVVGIAGLFAHFCITTALQFAPAVIVSPLDFVRLPIMAFIGMLFYNEALDIWVILGALLVFGGNFLNIYTEHRLSKMTTGEAG